MSFESSKTKTFGILSAGGDCPGLNAAIRTLCSAASLRYNMKAIGIYDGYMGLINGNARELKPADFEDILSLGGTILGSSRIKPYKTDEISYTREQDKVMLIKENYKKLGLDCLVVLGGNGTHSTAKRLSDEGLNILGIPKTIDNDIEGTEASIGFDTAVSVAAESIDRHHSTAKSHGRAMIVECMGHKVGWLALHAGIAGSADIILIPEIPYDINSIKEHLLLRQKSGRNYSVIAVAEGALSIEEEQMDKKDRKKFRSESHFISIAHKLEEEIESLNLIEARSTVIGYAQRGGTPSSLDRILAIAFGNAAAEHLADGNYGSMISLKGNEISSVKLDVPADKIKMVPMGHHLLKSSKSFGICLGN